MALVHAKEASMELVRDALGRGFGLGDLYDVHRDMRISGSPWDMKRLQDAANIQTVPINHVNYKLVAGAGMSSKLAVLNATGDLKLSVLSGLVDVKGAASYLNDETSSGKSAMEVFKTLHDQLLQRGEGSVKEVHLCRVTRLDKNLHPFCRQINDTEIQDCVNCVEGLQNAIADAENLLQDCTNIELFWVQQDIKDVLKYMRTKELELRHGLKDSIMIARSDSSGKDYGKLMEVVRNHERSVLGSSFLDKWYEGKTVEIKVLNSLLQDLKESGCPCLNDSELVYKVQRNKARHEPTAVLQINYNRLQDPIIRLKDGKEVEGGRQPSFWFLDTGIHNELTNAVRKFGQYVRHNVKDFQNGDQYAVCVSRSFGTNDAERMTLISTDGNTYDAPILSSMLTPAIENAKISGSSLRFEMSTPEELQHWLLGVEVSVSNEDCTTATIAKARGSYETSITGLRGLLGVAGGKQLLVSVRTRTLLQTLRPSEAVRLPTRKLHSDDVLDRMILQVAYTGFRVFDGWKANFLDLVRDDPMLRMLRLLMTYEPESSNFGSFCHLVMTGDIDNSSCCRYGQQSCNSIQSIALRFFPGIPGNELREEFQSLTQHIREYVFGRAALTTTNMEVARTAAGAFYGVQALSESLGERERTDRFTHLLRNRKIAGQPFHRAVEEFIHAYEDANELIVSEGTIRFTKKGVLQFLIWITEREYPARRKSLN